MGNEKRCLANVSFRLNWPTTDDQIGSAKCSKNFGRNLTAFHRDDVPFGPRERKEEVKEVSYLYSQRQTDSWSLGSLK